MSCALGIGVERCYSILAVLDQHRKKHRGIIVTGYKSCSVGVGLGRQGLSSAVGEVF